eukprot:TRINITY_DN1258_c0_g1_i1.p1 TRINITY_DN1258_c0_g1~~TRINITY_DN1258_c0_g1_i1.p1  ORF type:complete len:205 (+),score=40.61 TRINITY_DN1258_c0_g1_i1:30-644(+)
MGNTKSKKTNFKIKVLQDTLKEETRVNESNTKSDSESKRALHKRLLTSLPNPTSSSVTSDPKRARKGHTVTGVTKKKNRNSTKIRASTRDVSHMSNSRKNSEERFTNVINERTVRCKLLLIGDCGVGKTSVMVNFTDGIFKGEDELLDVDFKIRNIEINFTGSDGSAFSEENETVICKLEIWDTAGRERFRGLARNPILTSSFI